MCGLFALVGTTGPVSVELRPLFDSLRHRGPDDHGWLTWSSRGTASGGGAAQVVGSVVLGHTRLSILDPSPQGHQPMSSPDGRFHITYNGEVYNYLELRPPLEAAGWVFRTGTDTEVVLAAWAIWGADALSRFKGMFAFVVLDTRDRTVVAVRDFFGIKPLFLARWCQGLAFASEVPALLALQGVGRRLRPDRVFSYLRFGDCDDGPTTMLEDVQRVEPGTLIRVDLDTGACRAERYWQLRLDRTAEISFDAAKSRLRDMFLDNVLLHLRSDVPVGMALSGGIDSSATVCALRHLRPTLDIHAFSYIDADATISELDWVERAVRETGVCSHRVTPADGDLDRDLPDLVRRHGEPVSSTSAYAQYRLFKLAREHGVKVVIEGQGADEILAGYTSYKGARLASLLRQGRLAQATAFALEAGRQPQCSPLQLGRFAGLMLLPGAAGARLRRFLGRAVVPPWVDANWFADQGTDLLAVALPLGGHELGVREHLRLALQRSLETSLPRQLREGDRNAMAFSVENRVPFLTVELAEFVLSLPENYIVSDQGVSKHVFREAMRGIVPDAILDRRSKLGFTTSEARWLKHRPDWFGERSEAAAEIAYFDPERVRRLDPAVDPGFAWRIGNFVDWCAMFDLAPPARRPTRRWTGVARPRGELAARRRTEHPRC